MNDSVASMIFNSLSHPAMVMDADLNVTAVSDGFTKAFLATREEWVGQNIRKFQEKRVEIGAKENDNFLDALESVKKYKTVLERPIQKWKIDGVNYTYWVPKTTPVLDKKGEILYILHELRDVTPLVISEQYLNKLEIDLLEQTTLTDILDRQSDGFFVIDHAFHFTYMNKRFLDFINMKHEDVIGKHIDELFPGKDAQNIIKRYKDVAKNRKPLHFQENYLNTVLSIDAYPADNGGAAVFYRDVTEKVRHEEELKKNRELFKRIIDQIPAYVTYSDMEERYIVVNNTSSAWLGVKAHEIEGRLRKDVLGEALYLKTKPLIEAAYRGETTKIDQTFEKDGKPFHLNTTYVPHIDQSGTQIGVIAIGVDLSAERNTQAELEKALKVRDDFISIASHELKTPLTTLMLQNQFARKKLVKNGSLTEADFDHFLRVSLNSMNKLNRLIDDMLDVTRIHNGKIKLNLEEVNLSDLTKEIVSRYSAHVSNMTFKTNADVTGIWDKVRIDQVISNLVTNAIKYGNETPIEVETYLENNFAVVSVKDSGPGIAPENHDKIFDRFERINPSAMISGLGLGLHIVKEILERHGGNIQVFSDLGQGAQFKVSLPINR